MDTRGKMNAEFHNNVNKILARHEINFDLVNIALQMVLTELQALKPLVAKTIALPKPTHLHVMNPHTHILLILTL